MYLIVSRYVHSIFIRLWYVSVYKRYIFHDYKRNNSTMKFETKLTSGIIFHKRSLFLWEMHFPLDYCQIDIVQTLAMLLSTTTSIQIQNSFFGANKNMKSVMILNVNIPANITNCVFIDNSGDSVALVYQQQISCFLTMSHLLTTT